MSRPSRSSPTANILTSQEPHSVADASSSQASNPSLIEAATVIRGVSEDIAGGVLNRDSVQSPEGMTSGTAGSQESASRPPEPGDRSPAAVAQVLVGHRLNHFFLEAMIGGGGMGAVFRAKDEQLDRTVAVKVVPFAGSDTELQRRFRNEAQSAAKLDHPHIAQVFDVGSDATWHYIVFEYIRGVNIRDLINREGVLPIGDAVLYTMQLADALQHASDRGITHRDVKPSNVVLTSGRIKLVDMGLARSEKYDLSADMTASGVTLGTFDYISPEQARDPRSADIRSDLYSLGCTLFFMLSGRPPYAGGTMLQKLLAHGNEPPPDIRTLRSGISDELAEVLECLLAKNPADRFQTPLQLFDALQGVASRSSLLRLRRDTTVVARPAWQRWMLGTTGQKTLPWLFGIAMVVFIGGILQVQSMVRDDELSVPQGFMPPSRASDFVEGGRPPTEVDSSGGADPQTNLLDDRRGFDPATDSDGPSMFADAASVVASDASIDEPSSDGVEGAGEDVLIQPSAMRASNAFPRQPRLDAIDSDRFESPIGGGEPGPVDNVAVAANPSRLDPVFDLDSVDGAVRVTNSPGYDALQTRSLSEAIEIAKREGIHVIDLDVTDLVSEPIFIGGDDLTIRSVVGGTTITFDETLSSSPQTSTGSIPATRSSIAINAAASNAAINATIEQIEFQDVHLQWVAGDCTSLFRLDGTELLNLTDCVITIDATNVDTASVASRASVSDRQLGRMEDSMDDLLLGPGGFSSATMKQSKATEFAQSTSNDMPDIDVIKIVDRNPMRGGNALTFVDLNNVVVRGEASMISVSGTSQLDLAWDNGLLAISGAMIRAGGSASPDAGRQRIELTLDQLVVDAQAGLVQMEMDSARPYPVDLVRSARKSVFIVRQSQPHIVISGSGQIRQPASFIQLSGTRNAFDSDPTLTDPLVRLSTADGVTQTVPMRDMWTPAGTWLREKEPSMSVRWVDGDRPMGPWHDRQTAQYSMVDGSTRGFDLKWLPSNTMYTVPIKPSQ